MLSKLWAGLPFAEKLIFIEKSEEKHNILTDSGSMQTLSKAELPKTVVQTNEKGILKNLL
jgi:hypothetical protein